MLAELRQERDRLEEAIVVVERLAVHGGKRRGRPPKWMQKARGETVGSVPRKRKAFTAETRARMAKSQRARWAALRGA